MVPHMNASATGGKTGEYSDRDKVAGVSFRSAPKFHKAPWQLRLYHNGTESYSYHKTREDAIRAKGKADRLKKREGARALGYDRAAQLEYEEARRILGPDISLVDAARQIAARIQSGHVSRTVAEASEEFFQTKVALGRSRRHVQDIRQRLTHFSAAFQDRLLETVSHDAVLDFLRSLTGGPRKVWNYYGTIASLFHHGARRAWIDTNPILRIDVDADLPAKPKSRVQVLTVEQGKAAMRQIERTEPSFIPWACIQYFVGIRDAEADRFRGEWIDRKKRQIIIPGWHLDGETVEPITKGRDDWVIDKSPPAFWKWVDRYPDHFSPGPLPYPSFRSWGRIRDALVTQGVFPSWPRNGFRHSFATYHLSWQRDAQATSFLLRHRNPAELWQSYFAKFVSRAEAQRYFALLPEKSP